MSWFWVLICHFRFFFGGEKVMDDRWDNKVKEYGAINITGFRIVDSNRNVVRQFLRGWEKLDPAHWPGAGRPYIQVRLYKSFFLLFLLLFFLYTYTILSLSPSFSFLCIIFVRCRFFSPIRIKCLQDNSSHLFHWSFKSAVGLNNSVIIESAAGNCQFRMKLVEID